MKICIPIDRGETRRIGVSIGSTRGHEDVAEGESRRDEARRSEAQCETEI